MGQARPKVGNEQGSRSGRKRTIKGFQKEKRYGSEANIKARKAHDMNYCLSNEPSLSSLDVMEGELPVSVGQEINSKPTIAYRAQRR